MHLYILMLDCACLQVLRYLQAFASAFHLKQCVQFDTEVTSAVPVFAHTQNQTDQAQQQSAASNVTSNAEGMQPQTDNHLHTMVQCVWQCVCCMMQLV